MRVYLVRFAVTTGIMFAFFALALMLPAWRLTWLAGWAWLALFFGFYISVHLWLYKNRPTLFKERTRFGTSDQQGFDKLLFPMMLAFAVFWLAFMSADATRLHWSLVPLWVQGVGALVLLVCFWLLFLTFMENEYLATVVRLQEDRGHAVVSTGPYHVVRHPMYAGMVLLAIGTPLLLGSFWGLLVGTGFVAILVRRTVLEEQALRLHLPGYADYMGQVKFRMIPFVW
jgi:protein-S-isoprenylcysteine O-methyltransferase Ste14